MKHYTIIPILISIICLGYTTLQAQYPQNPHVAQTSLTIVSDQQTFWVFIDEIQQNDYPSNSIKIEQIPYGEHYLRVELNNREHITFGQYVMLDQTGSIYRLDNQKHLYGFSLYYGIPRPEQIIMFKSVQPEEQHTYSTTNAQAGFPMSAAMNEKVFQMALALIKNESFENTKLSTAKQVAYNNLLTVSQISRICQLFEFDNTKLDFAKTAFYSCVNPNQYYLLHSVFTFDNSKKELDKFVEKNR